MKRIILLCLAIFLAVGASAQNMYRVTGNNVNVRKGPGKNYGVIAFDGCSGWTKWQLDKSDIVRYLGKQKNGFMYVEAMQPSSCSASYREKGWISSQFLKQMKAKCPNCNGKGFFNRPCTDWPDDEGYGHPHACICQHDVMVPGGNYSAGKQVCNRCNGAGYL